VAELLQIKNNDKVGSEYGKIKAGREGQGAFKNRWRSGFLVRIEKGRT
jgi:hypothetical protein